MNILVYANFDTYRPILNALTVSLESGCASTLFYHQIVTAATGRNACADADSSLPAAVPQFPLLSDDVRRLMLTSQTREGIEESAEVIRDAEQSPAFLCRLGVPKSLSIFIQAIQAE